jgi:hypothetical protein
MMTVDAGITKPGEVNLRITRTYPVLQVFRLYTTSDGGVTKDYIDLTGYTGEAQVRAHPDGVLLLDLVVVVADPQSGDDAGKVTVSATADDTSGLVERVARWDLRLVDPDGVPRRWLKGAAPIDDPVTEESA